MTKVCFQALPRPAFVRLQQRLFPLYFGIQTFLLSLTAITYPAHGLFSLAQSKADWIPFVVSGVAAGLNCLQYGPLTERAMIERDEQGNTGP